LAPIRDTDVCLEILKTFRSPGAVEAAAESPDACDYLYAIQALERALRARRKASGRQMVRVLKARLFRITDSARSLGKGLDGADGAHCDSRAALQALMDELAAAAPILTPAGLHSFRKLAKKGRYLAEFMPHPDAWTQEADSTCRSIQRAVGQWRDWAALARFARRNVRGAGPVLTRQLACTASRLLQEALCQCRQPVPGPAERTRRQPVRRYVRVARRPA
jgi:CHAD domain-containing protein